MTRRCRLLSVLLVTVSISLPGAAIGDLFDRGGGLIYDDVLDVTWLQDANFAQTSGVDPDGRMTLAEAQQWVSDLTYYDSVRNIQYDDWRLPNATDVGSDGATYTNIYEGVDYGYNITTPSELSYMFYQNLGNLAAFTTAGFSNNCDTSAPNFCLSNVGPFVNLQSDRYWTSQQYGSTFGNTLIFKFNNGFQQYTANGNVEYVWPVRDGDVGPPAHAITINTGNYTGLWDVDLSGEFLSGTQTLQLQPGTYRFRAGTLATTLFFSVDSSGFVSLAAEYDGISATGGVGQLNLLTRAVQVNPGTYEGKWAISRVRNSAPGAETVYLIPSDAGSPSGRIGVPYALSIGAGTSALILYLRGDGSISLVDGNVTFSGAVSVANDSVSFNNTLVAVSDRNSTGARWQVIEVTSPFPAATTGNQSVVLVPHNQYIFQTVNGTSIFSVSDPCSIDPEEQNMGGIIFDVTCGQLDSDSDGVSDELDNCPTISNPAQVDNDGDGLGDVCDPDIDNDGVENTVDNCDSTPNPDQTDTDIDGIGNACDDDDDGDGVSDVVDNCVLVPNLDQQDVDGDFLGDACDADLDGDSYENELDNCPFVPNQFQEDTDIDGVGDDCDADDDNDGVCDIGVPDLECVAGPDNCPVTANADQLDLDGDNIGDACDSDVDGDGIANTLDNCPLDGNPDQNDTDNDGLGDVCDEDDDADGVLDDVDNCPFLVNPSQVDTDGDGRGDICDADIDGDGVDNAIDNCPAEPNSDQYDLDGDSIGDACDSDIDGDNVVEEFDQCAATPFGETVDPANGCSLDQLCPCDGPRGTTRLWKNHGKFVSCMAHAANDFVNNGLITLDQREAIMSSAAQTSCGRK